MEIRIGHIRDQWRFRKEGWFCIPVCRCHGKRREGRSILGNPFRDGRDGDRDEVIRKYRLWLWKQVLAKGDVLTHLCWIAQCSQRQRVMLLCHCAPKRCHAEVVASAVRWLAAMDEKIAA